VSRILRDIFPFPFHGYFMANIPARTSVDNDGQETGMK